MTVRKTRLEGLRIEVDPEKRFVTFAARERQKASRGGHS